MEMINLNAAKITVVANGLRKVNKGNSEKQDKNWQKWQDFLLSIENEGVRDPITVRRAEKGEILIIEQSTLSEKGTIERYTIEREATEGEYVLVDGLHRVTALLESNREDKTIQAVVQADSADDALAKSVLHNVQRFQQRKSEVANAILELLKRGMNDKDIAAAFGFSNVGRVRDYLQINTLPDSYKAALDTGELQLTSAVELIRAYKVIKDVDTRGELFETAKKSTVEGLQKAIQKAKTKNALSGQSVYAIETMEFKPKEIFDKTRWNETWSRLKVAKENAEIDGEELSSEEKLLYDTFAYILTVSEDDLENQREAFEVRKLKLLEARKQKEDKILEKKEKLKAELEKLN